MADDPQEGGGEVSSSRERTSRATTKAKPAMHIDQIMGKIGGFGRYQVLIGFCLPCFTLDGETVLNPKIALAPYWKSFKPPYYRTCQVFLILCISIGGSLYAAVQNLSTTFVEANGRWYCISQQCANETGMVIGKSSYDMVTLCRAIKKIEREEWSWENGNHTALTDYDQACGSQTIVTKILYFIPGVLLGGIVFGIMGWSTGRKTPFLSALLTSMVASVISAASREYILFVILRVLLGASIAGYEVLYFCWAMELVGRKWRPLAVGIQALFWSAGLAVVYFINMTFEYWRYKMVYVGIVSLTFIFVYAAVPESPYWLLAKGQEDQATTVLKRISILNGCRFPDCTLSLPSIKTREKVVSLFQPRFRRIGWLLMVHWFLVGMVYYYIHLSLRKYGPEPTDFYVDQNFLVAAATEVPAALLGGTLLCTLTGRKVAFMINCGLLAATTVLSLLTVSVIDEWSVQRGAVLVGMKFSVVGARLSLALWTSEIAPTTLRPLLLGLGLASSAFGVLVTSVMVSLAASHVVVVVMVLSVTALAIVAATQLPDSSNWDLPHSLNSLYNKMHQGSRQQLQESEVLQTAVL
eukprot:sb/3463354/